MSLRKIVFWVHLACGVTVGSVVLVMSVTGVLLTYQKQMTQWADRDRWAPAEAEGRIAPVEELVATANAFDPGIEATSLVYYADPEGPVGVSLGRGRSLYLDPSTAEVRGEGSAGVRAFFSSVVGWHRWFNVTGEGRSAARAVTGWSNLVFLGLVLSGLYLWLPRRWRWQNLRPILLLDPRARGRARDFNWHHVFGFWLAVPLAVVVASATVISFPWASDLAYRVVGDVAPDRPAAPRSARVAAYPVYGAGELGDEGAPEPFDLAALDPIVEAAKTRIPGWRTLTLTLPSDSDAQVRVTIDEGWGGAPQKRHSLAYDAATGREVSYSGFADQSPGRRFRSFLRFAHTGEYFGLAGQTLAGLASLAGALLVWSGIALAWRRLVGPLLRRRSRRAGAAG